MSNLILPTTGGTLFIDNSSLEKFTTCERSAEYYIIHRREAADPKWALRFGSIIHTMLEMRYRNPQWVQNGQDPHLIASQFQALAAEFDTTPAPELDHRNYNYAMELLDAYNLAHPNEPFTVLKHPTTAQPLVEVPFAVPLGTIKLPQWIWLSDLANPDSDPWQDDIIPVVWTGKIDLIYRYDGMTYILDHKTTSMMGPSFFQEFDLSQPMYGYVWAAEQLLSTQIDAFAVNAICTRRLTKTGKGIECARKSYYVDREQLVDWKKDIVTHITTFLLRISQNYFPKNTKWCMGKYGQCPYWDVCTLPSSTRSAALFSNTYQDVTWSPLNKN